MFRISNCLVGLLNFISLVLGLAAVAGYLYITIHDGATQCEKDLQIPLLAVGVFLVVVSLMGLIGACCRSNFFLVLYLIVMFLLVIGILCFSFWSFLVTNKSVGNFLSISGSKHLDFKNWLKNNVVNDEHWGKIRNCLKDTELCKSLNEDQVKKETAAFFKMTMKHVQTACCQPPSECGFQSTNATFWTAPKNGPATGNGDCKIWNNDHQKFCYECESCRDGFITNIKKLWRDVAVFNLIALVVVITAYIFGSCARKNNKIDNKKKRRSSHP